MEALLMDMEIQGEECVCVFCLFDATCCLIHYHLIYTFGKQDPFGFHLITPEN